MSTIRLARVCSAVFLAAAGIIASHAQTESEASSGVVVGVSGHVVVENHAVPSRGASVGMRLESGDVVVLEAGASAEIYLRGGGVVRLRGATRFEMPRAADPAAHAATQAKLGSGTIAQLESGLWVLNDPAGSLLVSPMRGGAGWESSDAAVALTPRYEALTEPHAVFVWSGGPAKARVVVAKHREIVWTGAPAAPGTIVDAGAGLPLAAGEVYTWWLEPEAGGPPLTAGMPFRVAASDVIERTRALEAELRSLSAVEGAPAADYLRLAHYVGAMSWTRVLELSMRLAPGDARARALAAAAAGLRLDERQATSLAALLASGVTTR